MSESAKNHDDVDFASFLDAVRAYEDDKPEVRVTAHSSSVTTTDWQRIADTLHG